MIYPKSCSVILLSCLVSIFFSTQVMLLCAVHPSDAQSILVSVESPREDREYAVGEIVPVSISVADNKGSAITNATVEVTTQYDNQYVHVPFLQVTLENQSEAAVYAPDPDLKIRQGQISEEALVQLNNQGFLRLPSSEGEWSVTLQVKPESPYYSPYMRVITINIRAGPPVGLYLIVAGWVCVIAVGVFLLRRKKLRKTLDITSA